MPKLGDLAEDVARAPAHDWWRFDALEKREPSETFQKARAVFLNPDPSGWILWHYGHKAVAWTPNGFVELWARGYR